MASCFNLKYRVRCTARALPGLVARAPAAAAWWASLSPASPSSESGRPSCLRLAEQCQSLFDRMSDGHSEVEGFAIALGGGLASAKWG